MKPSKIARKPVGVETSSVSAKVRKKPTLERQPREDDPRFQRSLLALHNAVIDMLEAGPIENISITALVQSAGVTRPTFYQHFLDIPDAARKVALARLDAAFVAPVPFHPDFVISAKNISVHISNEALPVIYHLSAHRKFYLHVLDGAGTASFFEEVIAFLAGRFLPDAFELAASHSKASRDDLMLTLAGGTLWLMIRWLREGGEGETPEQTAERLAAVASSMIIGKDISPI